MFSAPEQSAVDGADPKKRGLVCIKAERSGLQGGPELGNTQIQALISVKEIPQLHRGFLRKTFTKNYPCFILYHGPCM